MKKILITEDDEYIGNMLAESLSWEGYLVSRAYSGTEALLLLEKERPDLILLDLMLPGISGEELLDRIRDRQIPVIVVSARTGTEDKVKLLLEGASDYVTKPFEIKELLARIVACLRQAQMRQPGQEQILESGGLRMNPGSHEVWVRCPEAARPEEDIHPSGCTRPGAAVCGLEAARPESVICQQDTIRTENPLSKDTWCPVTLTKTEFAILKLLLSNAGQALSKSVILDRISEDTPDCTDSSLKQHISNLRKKLREGGSREYIESVWGIGFRLREEDPIQEG